MIFQIEEKDGKLISRYLRGVYNKRPARPKYSTTWDPYPVLNFLGKLYPLEKLELKDITIKLSTLLALISAHRLQTLSKIRLENIKQLEDRIEIQIPDRIKSSKPKNFQPTLVLPFFKEIPSLCLASTLLAYIEKTSRLRPPGENRLILTTKNPIHAASVQTISRYIKTSLTLSGIDTSIFSSYSTRHAATSAAFRAGVNIDVIRKAAGWSYKSEVFNTFYNRPIIHNPNEFAEGVLKAAGMNVKSA